MPGRYAANTAALWTGLGPTHAEVLHDTPELTALWKPGRNRVQIIMRRPLRELPPFAHEVLTRGRPNLIEDPFGALDTLEASGTTGLETVEMTVMVREPAPIKPTPRKADLEIVQAADRRELEEAEYTIVYGFPYFELWSSPRGQLLPPEALSLAGLRVWLARRQGMPAAVCCTYDDGAAVGVYWLTTLPEQRGRGIARAILTRALTAHQDREAVLTTIPESAPLYADLGFHEVSSARWHSRR